MQMQKVIDPASSLGLPVAMCQRHMTHRSDRLAARRTALLALAIAWALLSVRPATAQPVFTVVVGEAAEAEVNESVKLVGSVTAARTSRVSTEVAGLVAAMPARQGDRLSAGQIICELDHATLELRLAEEKAAAQALKARHEELLAGTRAEDLTRLKAVLDEAVADFEQWEFERQRVRRLYENTQSNEKELRDTEAAFTRAQRRKVAAEADYEKAVSGPRKEEIARAAHDVAAQEAVVARLETELAKTYIRAPFGGFVTQRAVELGEWVGVGDTIVELAELDRVLVRVDLPERAYPFVKVGDIIRVQIDALKRSFEGVVRHIIPRADLQARTVPIDIEVENEAGLLAAGMFARAVVPAGPTRPEVVVPKDAIVERDNVMYIAKVMPGRGGKPAAMLMPVTVGVDVGASIAITSRNVSPGDKIVVRGNENLAPFPMTVQVVDDNGSPVALDLGGGMPPGAGGPPPNGERGPGGPPRDEMPPVKKTAGASTGGGS